MDWDKIEKARKGLRTCVESEGIGCPLSCPYYEPCMSDPRHIYSPMMNDVLTEYERMMEQIKSLEAARIPRLMTLEEVHDIDWDYCYLEEEVIQDNVLQKYCGKHRVKCITWPSIASCVLTFGNDGYGKRWRCWTQRPTDEQRKAVAWG